jgi:acyl-coenzyme A synthetase/AMP-(fatty) acid ligase
LEDMYYAQPDVLHAAVVECMDGEVEAFVELLPKRTVDAESLGSSASAKLSEGLRPRRTTILESMPRTFSGKANRLLLSQGCG